MPLGGYRGLALDLVSGWLVVMHKYWHYFPVVIVTLSHKVGHIVLVKQLWGVRVLTSANVDTKRRMFFYRN